MHDELSRFVVSMFKSFHSHLSWGGASLSVLTDQLWGLRSPHINAKQARDLEVCEESSCEWVRGIDGRAIVELFEAMRQLVSRPYFWRIWTLQELWVTHEVRFFCEFDELSIRTLLFWWGEWGHSHGTHPALTALMRLKDDSLMTVPSRNPLGSVYESILYERRGGSREIPASASRRFSTRSLLALCRERKCQDPRDIVYGTLTMADRTSKKVEMPDGNYDNDEDEPPPILPNYNLSAFELAKILMPRFDDGSEMKHMCELLHISPETEEIQQGIALQSVPWPQVPVSASKDEPHWSKYSGSLTRIKMNGYQLGSDMQCQLGEASKHFEPFTRIKRNREHLHQSSENTDPFNEIVKDHDDQNSENTHPSIGREENTAGIGEDRAVYPEREVVDPFNNYENQSSQDSEQFIRKRRDHDRHIPIRNPSLSLYYEHRNRCCCGAIACREARDGDWLMNIGRKTALVLREYGEIFFVVGKAFYTSLFSAHEWPNELEMSLWLDAEDAVVLFCSPQVPFSRWQYNRVILEDDSFGDNILEYNVEEVSAFVNNRVCREWGSSFVTITKRDESDDERSFLQDDSHSMFPRFMCAPCFRRR
jgi:hypothetical protein